MKVSNSSAYLYGCCKIKNTLLVIARLNLTSLFYFALTVYIKIAT